MKIHRILSLALTVALLAISVTGLRAGDSPEKSEAKPVPVKDEALRFILDKTKQYTEVGENALAKAVDVASVEAPKLIEEYLTWKFWELGLYTAVGAVLTAFGTALPIFAFWSFSKKKSWIRDGSSYDADPTFLGLLVSVLGTLASLVAGGSLFFSHVSDFLQVWLAPRVFLMERVAEMIR